MQISLRERASERTCRLELPLGFDAFGNRDQLERGCEADDAFGQNSRGGIVRQPYMSRQANQPGDKYHFRGAIACSPTRATSLPIPSAIGATAKDALNSWGGLVYRSEMADARDLLFLGV